MSWDSKQRCEEKGDQLLELRRPGVGIAAGGWGMPWLHMHVNKSGDVVTALSFILGKEKEGRV